MPGYLPGFALITATVITITTFTMNSITNRNHAVVFLADGTAACSMIGYHSNS